MFRRRTTSDCWVDTTGWWQRTGNALWVNVLAPKVSNESLAGLGRSRPQQVQAVLHPVSVVQDVDDVSMMQLPLDWHWRGADFRLCMNGE